MGLRFSTLGNITVINRTLYIGTNPGALVGNIAVTVGTSAVAWSLASPHPAFAAVGIALVVVTLYFLFRAAFVDPGIIPRRRAAPIGTATAAAAAAAAAEAVMDAQSPSASDAGHSPAEAAPQQQPQHQQQQQQFQQADADEIMIRVTNPHTKQQGLKTVELAWCYTCNIRRPLRSSHCRWCDCCVSRMDHHCFWIGGTCVGERNYASFFLYINSVFVLSMYTVAVMIAAIIIKARELRQRHADWTGNDAFEGALAELRYAPVIVMIVGVVVIAMVGGLACYHCGLTADDATTHEMLRRYYLGYQSPFDRGDCSDNCSAVICGPTAKPVLERYTFDEDGYLSPENTSPLPPLDAGIGVQREALFAADPSAAAAVAATTTTVEVRRVSPRPPEHVAELERPAATSSA